jgi:hypothetical protein
VILKSTMSRFAVLALLCLAAVGCGGHSGPAKVWCVAPGEKVTPAFKREYPDLYIPKVACDAANR